METLDKYILDILNLDIETYKNIREQLNDTRVGTFISKNSGKPFPEKEIVTSLERLIKDGYVEPTIFNGVSYQEVARGEYDYTDDAIWYRIKGTNKQ